MTVQERCQAVSMRSAAVSYLGLWQQVNPRASENQQRHSQQEREAALAEERRAKEWAGDRGEVRPRPGWGAVGCGGGVRAQEGSPGHRSAGASACWVASKSQRTEPQLSRLKEGEGLLTC